MEVLSQTASQTQDAMIVGFILGVITLIWLFWPRRPKD